MGKSLWVAREELRFHMQQWSFYLSLALTLGMFVAAGALPQLRAAAEESPLADVETVFTVNETITIPTGYVDYAGIIITVPAEQADNFRAFADEAAAVAALRAGEVESYYVIAADYVQTGNVIEYSLDAQLISSTDDAVEALLRDNLLHMLDDSALAARVKRPANIVRRGPPPPTFRFLPADLDLGRLASAGLVVGLFAFIINIGGALLPRALQREAETRVLEMLITSTTPEQFIGGKLLGLTTLALGQASISLLAGVLVYGNAPGGGGPAALPPILLTVGLPYLMLGYLAYSGAMLSVAALWPTLAESFQLQAIMRLITLTPLAGVLFILPNADSAISIALTINPITSPLLMPFRILITDVPGWQIGAGLAALVLWAAFSVWVSMRLFRAQSLLTGRTPTPKAVWAALHG